MSKRDLILLVVFIVALLFLGMVNLESVTLTWDEGWTLTVARTWVEQGFYGRLQDGQLAPPGLEAAFPITASVALSFRLLGVGIWQGRLVGVIYLVGAVGLIGYLARCLYNRSIAIGTLAVLFLMSSQVYIHPLFLARMVLAEIPMVFFLVGGYVCFLKTLSRSFWFIVPTMVFWGIAIISKAQPMPFWIVSLSVPLLLAILKRQWRTSAWLLIALIGSWYASGLVLELQQFVVNGHTLPRTPLVGLTEVIALVLLPSVRIGAVMTALIIGLPTLFGLGHAAWHWLKDAKAISLQNPIAVIQLALLSFAGSWLAWYTLLSSNSIRYLFPVTFFGSIFVAAMLYDWTERFDFNATIVCAGGALRRLRFNKRAMGAIVAILLVALFVPVTIGQLYREYTSSDTSAIDVARFFNTQTSSDALIESYESELFFLLNRRYHFPPDQTNVGMNRHSLPDHPGVDYGYDPLAANPDYLVTGVAARSSGLYDPVIATNAVRLIEKIGDYRIYERVR